MNMHDRMNYSEGGVVFVPASLLFFGGGHSYWIQAVLVVLVAVLILAVKLASYRMDGYGGFEVLIRLAKSCVGMLLNCFFVTIYVLYETNLTTMVGLVVTATFVVIVSDIIDNFFERKREAQEEMGSE